MKTPAPETIRNEFAYCPETGALWRTKAKRGVRAGLLQPRPNREGYLRATVHKRLCYLHHIAWVLMTGAWPLKPLDHVNGKRADNRWSNLREATPSQNSMNTKLYARNRSGYRGVSWHEPSGKWRAEVAAKGVRHYLGLFPSAKAAAEAAEAKRLELHSSFARRH